MKYSFAGLWCVFASLFFCHLTSANEELGRSRITNLYIEAEYTVTEGQKVNASIHSSELEARWDLNKHLSTSVALGGQSLLARPIFFKPHASEDQFGLTKAYAEYKGILFDIQAGLLPIKFGVYGRKERFELLGHRSLLFKNRVVSLRDIGIKITSQFNGFKTSLTAHNGESFEDDDDRMFFTGQWEWTDQKFFTAGLSAQTGTTKPQSTNGETTNILSFDGTLDAKWKIASLYFDWIPNNWILRAENYYGSMVQEKVENSLVGGTFELGYHFSPSTILALRHDVIDPNIHSVNDKISETSLVIDVHDRYRNSSLLFVFTKKHEETHDVNDDYFSMIWKVTPFGKK